MPNAPYDKLLLEAGGGIIDAAQQADQEDAAVLAIGLGGTGTDALRRLKTKVYTRVKPDDPEAAVPKYSHIKFLSVDTDSQAMHNQTAHDDNHVKADDSLGQINLQSEFFDISYKDPISALLLEQKVLLAKDPRFNEWLQFNNIKAEVADNGAGGIRQLGRFLLFQKAGQFVETVKRLITEARQGIGGAKLYVHIFSGMSGGTGSGTFLDACYLVRYAIGQLGIGNATVMGYFFLPDVSMRPGLAETSKAFIRANGYAAMQELDYCMSFEENGDCWHQRYPGIYEPVTSRKKPVDLCHIVSATAVGGAVRGNAYDYALNVATDYVMDFTVASVDSEKFGLDSYYANVVAEKQNVPVAVGAAYDYVVLGAASAVVPHTRIMTYLAAGALRTLPQLLGQAPTEEEGLAFGRSIGLTYDQVYQRVTSHANMAFPMPDVRPQDAKDDERQVIDWFTQMEHDTQGRIKANTETLAKPLESYSGSEAGDSHATELSVMAALLKAMRQAQADPERGPAWAARMVAGGGGYDVLAQLEGIKATAQGNLGQETYNLREKPDNYYKVQKEMAQSFREYRFNPFKATYTLAKAYTRYASATRTVVDSEARCAAFQGVIDLVDALKPQVRKLSTDFAGPLRDCVARLDATFQADAQYLQAFADGTNEYETPIIKMSEVKPALDATLKGIDPAATQHELLERLLSDTGMSCWGPGGDDEKLARLVSAYILERFHDVSSRSLTDYLQTKYGLTDQDKLADRVYNGLLAKVNTDATPLFWNEVGYSTANASHFEYVTVPNTAPAVARAAGRLVKDPDYDVRRAAVTDRISVLRVIVGVPLWGYKGVDLYETVTDTPARHLYQPANRVEGIEPPASRDWNLLPSPTPWTVMYGHEDSHDRGTYERAEVAVRLFDEGLRCGVLELANAERDLYVHVMTDDFMQGIRTDYTLGKGYTQEAKRVAQRDKIQAKDQNRVFAPEGSTPHIKAPDNLICTPEDYFRDMFVRMPKFQEATRAELAKVEEIQGYIEELSPREDTDLNDICTALFTGVVKFEEAKKPVTYTDEWGEETVLSKRQMDHGGAPLYQTYLSYKGIAEAKKEEIRAKANEIVNADELPEDEVKAACRAVQEELKHSPDRLAFIKMKYPAEAQEAKEVLQGMFKQLNVFLGQNMLEL